MPLVLVPLSLFVALPSSDRDSDLSVYIVEMSTVPLGLLCP